MPLPVVFVAGSILLAISTPAIGIPALLLVGAGLWFTRSGSQRGRIATASTNYLALTPTQFEHALAITTLVLRSEPIRNLLPRRTK